MSAFKDDLPTRVRLACLEWEHARSVAAEARRKYDRLNSELMARLQAPPGEVKADEK